MPITPTGEASVVPLPAPGQGGVRETMAADAATTAPVTCQPWQAPPVVSRRMPCYNETGAGLIDTTGRVLFETPQTAFVTFLDDGLSVFSDESYDFYVYDETGRPVRYGGIDRLAPMVDYIDTVEIFVRDYLQTFVGEKCGVIDLHGREIIPPENDEIAALLFLHGDTSERVFLATKGDAYSIYNANGERLSGRSYNAWPMTVSDKAELFAGCIVTTETKAGKPVYGYILPGGDYKESQYNYVAAVPLTPRETPSCDAVVVRDNKGFKLLDLAGKALTAADLKEDVVLSLPMGRGESVPIHKSLLADCFVVPEIGVYNAAGKLLLDKLTRLDMSNPAVWSVLDENGIQIYYAYDKGLLRPLPELAHLWDGEERQNTLSARCRFLCVGDEGGGVIYTANMAPALDFPYVEGRHLQDNFFMVRVENEYWLMDLGESLYTPKERFVSADGGHSRLSGDGKLYGWTVVQNEKGWNILLDDTSYYLEEFMDEIVVSPVRDDQLIVKKDGKFGLVFMDGGQVLPCEYDAVTLDETTRLFQAKAGDKTTYISDQGVIFAEVKGEFVSKTWIIEDYVFTYNGLYGLVGSEGKLLLPAEYEALGEDTYGSGTIPARRDGRWGVLNKLTGQWIVAPVYDAATSFNSYGFAAVKLDGKWGSIDGEGQIALPPTYASDWLDSREIAPNFLCRWLVVAPSDNSEIFVADWPESYESRNISAG